MAIGSPQPKSHRYNKKSKQKSKDVHPQVANQEAARADAVGGGVGCPRAYTPFASDSQYAFTLDTHGCVQGDGAQQSIYTCLVNVKNVRFFLGWGGVGVMCYFRA